MSLHDMLPGVIFRVTGVLRRVAILVCCALVLAACHTRPLRSSGYAATGSGLVLTNVTVIDVNASTVASALRPDQTVVIDNRMIVDAGPADRVTVPRDGVRFDARGRFLIPGLWDSHTHLSLSGDAGLLAYVANGVTTVRDLGSQTIELQRWRGVLQRRELTGPRILTSGPTVEAAWWLDPALDLLAKDPALARFPIAEVSPVLRLGSPADAREVVDAIAAGGADLVKFRNLRSEEFRAVAAEAARRGLVLAGHAPSGMELGEAADLGLDTFEHAETVTARLGTADTATKLAQFGRLAAAGAAITPTLVTDVAYRQTPDEVARAIMADGSGRTDPRRQYVAPMLLRRWQFGLDLKRYERPNDWAALYRRELSDMQLARSAGVPLLVGTDVGVSLVYPGFSVHDELRLLVRDVGLSPLEALKAATVNAARAMRMERASGSMQPGQSADAVLLEANPLVDIRNTARIGAVIVRGQLFERVELDGMLRRASILASQNPSAASARCQRETRPVGTGAQDPRRGAGSGSKLFAAC